MQHTGTAKVIPLNSAEDLETLFKTAADLDTSEILGKKFRYTGPGTDPKKFNGVLTTGTQVIANSGKMTEDFISVSKDDGTRRSVFWVPADELVLTSIE